MKRIFVYEMLSGGGQVAGDGAADESLFAAGLAMRDAITADLLLLDDYRVSVAARKQAPPGPAPARPVEPLEGESAIAFVARQSDEHHLVWVVAPETDGLLASLRRAVDPARWLGCDGPAIELAAGKRATLRRVAEAAIATPLAFEHAPETTRWVVKPDDGAGALATRLHADREAACADGAQRSRAGQPTTIEPWVAGEALSLSLLCEARRTELLSINRQQIAVDAGGWLSYEGVEVNVAPLSGARTDVGADPRSAALIALAERVGRSIPGLRGFVGIDLVWHAQRGPVVIEVNPRVTCAYVGLSKALGRNLAAEVIAAHGRDAADGSD